MTFDFSEQRAHTYVAIYLYLCMYMNGIETAKPKYELEKLTNPSFSLFSLVEKEQRQSLC